MKYYYILAIRYLQQNRRRTIRTILGVALTVMFLYGFFNLMYSLLLQLRIDEREEQDYELVLLTEDEETIAQILNDPRVKSANLGPYYQREYDDDEGWRDVVYPNALYVNTVNPYRMNAIFQELQRKYGVSGDYHDALAELYLQGEDGSFMLVKILLVLLIGFLFSIFGIGIVRNGIHLNMLESVRDYGNLRCIGCSRRELRVIVFLQGLIMEGIGMFPGCLLGTIASRGIAALIARRNLFDYTIETIEFHTLPVVVIGLMFLFDLYFIMNENVNMVIRMSPVAAIRGEYQTGGRNQTVSGQGRMSGFIYRWFGIEGEYVYKNLVRNPRRFARTIAVMTFSVAALMGLGAAVSSYVFILQKNLAQSKYYQMYAGNQYDENESIDMVEASLPSADQIADLTAMKDITDVKMMYTAVSYLPTPDITVEHMAEDYLATDGGRYTMEEWESYQNQELTYSMDYLRQVDCFGYDEVDLARYQPVLLDGTLDVSPQGVVLVNQILGWNDNPYSHTEYDQYNRVYVQYLNYQVGDTIELLDVGELHRRLDSRLNDLWDEMYAELQALEQDSFFNEEHTIAEFAEDGWQSMYIETPRQACAEKIVHEYREQTKQYISECRRQMEEEGCYRTYVIEGIVSEDVNLAMLETRYIFGATIRILMPRDTYYDFTGTNADQPTGVMCHTDHVLPDTDRIGMAWWTADYARSSEFHIDGRAIGVGGSYCIYNNEFLYTVADIRSAQYLLYGLLVIVVFILMMYALNTINAVASNLYLREQEFAQLRVIGVSKRKLIRMVMLEGVLQAIGSDALGILLGWGISYYVFHILQMLYHSLTYHFPAGVAVSGIVLSILINCGAIYCSIRRLTNDLSEHLKQTQI